MYLKADCRFQSSGVSLVLWLMQVCMLYCSIPAALVMGDALPVIKDLYHTGGVLYFYMAAHKAVRHTVIVFIDSQINVADLLDLGPLVIAQLIPSRRQRIQGRLLELKELLAARGGPVVEAVVVIGLQKLTDGLIELLQAEVVRPDSG
jgi:hypothetical protein